MSGKRRYQRPGSLQPNIEDILEWSELPEDAFEDASAQEKEDFIKVRKSVSYWADAWRRLRKNKVAMIAFAIIIILVIFGICRTESGSLHIQTADSWSRGITSMALYIRRSGKD